jgi:trimeric autotransporter adhesin
MKRTITLVLIAICLFGVKSSLGQQWTAMGAGLGSGSDSVKTIAVNPAGEIYAGGTFAGYIKKYNASAGTWETLGSGVNGPVYSMAFKNNELFVGGSFTMAGGVTVNNFAKCVVPGNTWSDLGGGFNGIVNCVYISPGGVVYAGGKFTTSGNGSTTLTRIAKLVSTTWTALGTGVSANVRAITEHTIGGITYLFAGTDATANPIYKFDGVSTWNTVPGLSGGKVNALASYSGYLYAGGDFSTPSRAASRFDGTTWSTIITTFSGSHVIYAYFVRQSHLYIAGNFTNLGVGGQASYVGRITGPTVPIQAVLTANSLNGEVYALHNQSGKVIAGGKFTAPGANIAITSTTIGVNELESMVSEKSFFPNPVHQSATLRVTTVLPLKNPSVQILDSRSRIVSTNGDAMLNNNTVEFYFDRRDLAPGVYYYILSDEGRGITSDQFIVE